MSPNRRLAFIRDAIMFSAMTVYFCFPTQIMLVVSGAIFTLVIYISGKVLKGAAVKLDLRQKKISFGVVCFFILLWLGLLVSWILRHSSAPAWAMGSLGIIVLLTLLYASYDTTFGRNAKA